MAILGNTKATSLTLLDGVTGNLNPTSNNTYDLGTSSLKWRNLYATTFTGSFAGTATTANNAAVAGKAMYIEGTNDAANPGGALLRSGSGRADASPSGDTWIYWDTLGGTSTYWGIRHNQGNNTIGFQGRGVEQVSISLGESKVTATTFAGNATSATKLSNTPNNTTTFLRGDNTWNNELATSVGASTAILKLSTTASIASSYAWGMTHTVSNLGANANTIGVMTGQAMNSGNAGYLGFQWAGSNSDNNFVSLGIYSNDHLLKVYKTGITEISKNILKITANSNTVSIGSQNTSYTHIYNSANIPFIFNKSILSADAGASLGNTTYPFHNIVLGGATNATMTAASTNPKITFQEGAGTQPVHLIYTDYDNYRAPAGLKVIGGTSATPAWFEVEGNIYAAGFKGNADSATTATQAIHAATANTATTANFSTDALKLKYSSQLTTLESIDQFIESERFKVAKVSALDGHNGLERNDGMIITVPWSLTYGHQFYVDDSGYLLSHRYASPGTITNSDGTTATGAVWKAWKTMIDENNYTNYTVKKDGTGATGNWNINAATSTKTGNSTMYTYSENNNEVNFGGSNNSSTIYFGYRAKDSKPVPTKFIFGGSNGSASLQANTVYLGSGTTSYVSSSTYTGKANTAGTADYALKATTATNAINAGAATSTTKLITARTINGTLFDGTSNITTTNWGTSRTITIGATEKSVNGSANVSWTPTEINRVTLGSKADFERLVIAFCELTAANTGINSNWHGKVYYVRDNGLLPNYFADIDFTAKYGTANGFEYAMISDAENTSVTALAGEGYRACVFKYNNKYYGGLDFYAVQAAAIYTNGVGTFTPFIVKYYNHNNSSILNQEIHDSIIFSTSQCTRRHISITGNAATAITANFASNSATANFATIALYPYGFSARAANPAWGNTTGTSVTSWNESSGGSIDFRANNPSSGKLSVKVDGRFYVNEGNYPVAALKYANSYWGMADPDGTDNVWIRTTSAGIIPYQSGGAGSGHGGLGTSSWYFSSAYIDNMYGKLNGTATYATNATEAIHATTANSSTTATNSEKTRYIICPDTRSTAINPSDLVATTKGVQFDFKQKSITGLNANYSGVMSFRPYASGNDWSGGPAHQLAFDENGLHWRKSTSSTTWSAWTDIVINTGSWSITAATAGYATTAARAVTAGYATTAARATTAGNATDATKVLKAGDTMTGTLTIKGIKGTSGTDYGATLPSAGSEGQLFFQTGAEFYELPAGGAAGQALIKNSASDRDVAWGNVGGVMQPTTATKYYVSGSQSTSQNTNPALFNTAIYVQNSVLFGAAWNDYAEYRETKQQIEPGLCVIENGDDTMSLSTQRLQRGCKIVSDTYGFAIGETEQCKTPIAVSGRVLTYIYEGREQAKQHIGWPVCSGPNGTVSIMTEEEEIKYPSRIIGTISAVPDYEEWGTNKIKVNGRIWIYIK